MYLRFAAISLIKNVKLFEIANQYLGSVKMELIYPPGL